MEAIATSPALLVAVFVIALLVLLAFGVPVAVTLGVVGVLGMLAFAPDRGLAQLGVLGVGTGTNFLLVVAPLFILMSEIIARSQIGPKLFRGIQLWTGAVPGGAAVASVLASAGFSAISGSSPVTAATVGSIAVPEMRRLGYHRSLALGTVAAGGTLGILIPPSIALILYGVVTETPIGSLFLAGIIPGVMVAGLIALTVVAISLLKRGSAPRGAPGSGTPAAARERLYSLRHLLPVVLLFGLVMGSIYLGVATPTEAAAIGVLGAVGTVAVYGQLTPAGLWAAVRRAALTSAMFLFLVMGGQFVAVVLTRLRVPRAVADGIAAAELPRWGIILLIAVALLVAGMVLDPLSIVVVVAPILLPTVVVLGYDPIWFGIFLTLTIEIGMITPPVGFNLFILKTAVPDSTLIDIVRGAAWFLGPLLAALVIVGAFPQTALLLVQ